MPSISATLGLAHGAPQQCIKLPYGDLVSKNGTFNLSFAGKNKRLVMIVPSLLQCERYIFHWHRVHLRIFELHFLPLLLTLHLVVGFVLVITIYINFNSSIRKSYKKSSEESFEPPRFLNVQTPITEFCRLPEQTTT